MFRHSLGGEVIFFFAAIYCSLLELRTLLVSLLNKLWRLLDLRAKLVLRLTKYFTYIYTIEGSNAYLMS